MCGSGSSEATFRYFSFPSRSHVAFSHNYRTSVIVRLNGSIGSNFTVGLLRTSVRNGLNGAVRRVDGNEQVAPTANERLVLGVSRKSACGLGRTIADGLLISSNRAVNAASTETTATQPPALPPDPHGSLDAHLPCRLLVDGYRFILMNTPGREVRSEITRHGP